MGASDDEAVIHPSKPPDPKKTPRNDFPPLNDSKSFSHDRASNSNKTADQHFDKYLVLDFKGADRRHINPYKLKDELEKISGQKLLELVGNGKSKLTLKTMSANQTEKCLAIKSLQNKPCTITRHPSFNTNRGLIRVRLFDFQDMEEFKSNLSTQCRIDRIEKASFIKSRNGETSYIVTFSQETPYSVYIPGEVADIVVQLFKSRPMLCKKCLHYGHNQKRCSVEKQRCRRCTAFDHEEDECTEEKPKCLHCSEAHVTGHRDCVREKEEQVIVNVVEKEKVTFQRAKQMLTEVPIKRTNHALNAPKFHTHFTVRLPTGTKRSINPWFLEKSIQQHTGKKPLSCRGKPGDEDAFIVEVQTMEESRRMGESIIKIGTHVAKAEVNNISNVQRGLIFIQGYDLLDFNNYRESLINHHQLASVEHAHWIKLKDKRTQGLIVGFQRDMPNYLEIPGESKLIMVHEYKQRPLLCKTCLEYGHSKNVCKEKKPRCENCASMNHETTTCNDINKCLHCPRLHKTGDKCCQRYVVEEEVLTIQSKLRVSRNQAFIIYEREHPNSRSTNYAAVTAVPTTINLPQSSNTFTKPVTKLQKDSANPGEEKRKSPTLSESKNGSPTKTKKGLKNTPDLLVKNRASTSIQYDDNDGSVTIVPPPAPGASRQTPAQQEKRSRVSDEGMDGRGRSRYREDKRIKSDGRYQPRQKNDRSSSRRSHNSPRRSSSRPGPSNSSTKSHSPKQKKKNVDKGKK